MKKRVFSAALALLMLFTLVGCVTKNTDTSNKEVTAEGYNATYENNAKVYQKYIKLTEYQGIEAEVDKSILEITDKDVEDYIDSVLQTYATTEEVKTGVTAKGDTIVLDYSGKLNGVAFSGGTATDATYTVGSGGYIKDLDQGLEGLTVGQKYEIPCKFAEDYGNEQLNGKSVIFEVTVTAIKKMKKPDLTDEWVAANAEKLAVTEKTVAGLKKVAREYLQASAEAEYANKKFSSILSKLLDTIEVKEYPQKELDTLKMTWKNNVKSEYDNLSSYYSSMGISDFSAYLKAIYQCENDAAYDELATKTAKEYLFEKMVITLIAYENKLTVSADEIKKLGEEYAQYYQLDGYDAILEQYGKMLNAELGYGVLTEKVMDLVNEKAVEVPATTAAQKESESAS